jgi:hypothetical protein
LTERRQRPARPVLSLKCSVGGFRLQARSHIRTCRVRHILLKISPSNCIFFTGYAPRFSQKEGSSCGASIGCPSGPDRGS